MENVKTAMSTITCNIDRSIWRDLMQRSGMISLMDAQARDQWDKNLESDNIPEISEANILSTFEQLHLNKRDVFERGIINVFKACRGITKPIVPAALVKRSSSAIW